MWTLHNMLVKRKAIKLARQTLVVSLPSQWVKQCNISKGDEIDIKQQGNTLILSSDGDLVAGEQLTIDHSQVGRLLHRYIFKAYQHGVDEITINYSDPSMVPTLKEKLQELIGFELTCQTPSHCIIKDISGQKYQEFEDSLNRLFLITANILDDAVQCFKEKNVTTLPTLAQRDQDVNKFANFCLRLVSKNIGHTEKGQIYFALILGLERIGDELKTLFSEMHDQQIIPTADESNHLAEIKQLFDRCYRFTTSPSISKALEISTLYDQMKISHLSLKNPHQKTGASPLHHHLRTITELIVSLQEMQFRFITDAQSS